MEKSWIYLAEAGGLLAVWLIARALGVTLGVVPIGIIVCLLAFVVSVVKHRRG